MNAQELVDYVKMLWPKWEPTDEELILWRRRFNHAGDLDMLQKAVQDHYAECRFLSPRLANILGKYQEAYSRAHAPQQGDEGQGGYSGWAVLCVEGGRAGSYHPLYRNAQGFPDSEHQLGLLSEKWKTRAEVLYGGAWQVCKHWTENQLFEESSRLRHRASVEDWPAVCAELCAASPLKGKT